MLTRLCMAQSIETAAMDPMWLCTMQEWRRSPVEVRGYCKYAMLRQGFTELLPPGALLTQ